MVSIRFILVPLCLLTLVSSARADWSVVAVPTSEDLHELRHFNGGWMVVGDRGTILRSTDNGASFSTPASGTLSDLRSIAAPTGAQFYASGTGGTVIFSTDGIDWSAVGPASTARLEIFTRSSGWLHAVGDDGTIRRGTNFAIGGHWTQNGVESVSLNDGAGFSHNQAFAVGDGGLILKTTNGVDWFSKPSGTTENLYAFLEAGAFKFAVGANGTILRTTDSGESWTQIPSGTDADLHAITTSAVSGSFLMAVGEHGVALYSGDKGLTWCRKATGTTADLFGVASRGSVGYFAMGENGTLLAVPDNGGPCVVGTAIEQPVGRSTHVFLLEGPNPMQSRGRFSLEVSQDQQVRVTVVDLAGRRVADLGRRHASVGQPLRLGFSTDSLATGTYFVVVVGETFRDQHKMTVLR